MEKKNEVYAFTGMQKDMSVSKHPVNFLYDARNIRLTARDKDTLLSITNERGTEDMLAIDGDYLGHCLLDKYLVVFSTGRNSQGQIDYVTRIDLSEDNPSAKILYRGYLNFKLENPIEAIGSYENDKIQKVYWTDGDNQPRMINIVAEKLLDSYDEAGDYQTQLKYNDHSFDFIRELKLQETVSIKKELGASGMFAPGVIQYAFTYYNKYGQESNIFYTSPLQYISYRDRGASPEDTRINVAFNISVVDVDTNFDYVRIYSIQRTSLNGTPLCKRVQDVEIATMYDIPGPQGSTGRKYFSFLDTGTTGDTVDPTELLYKGGEEISAETIEQKDGTLFLGNLGIKREALSESSISTAIKVSCERRTIKLLDNTLSDYPYSNQLTAFSEDGTLSVPCSGFKWRDYYRLGMQFQYKTGKWSEPIFIDDRQQTVFPTIDTSGGKLELPVFKLSLSKEDSDSLYNKGYRKVRAVVVFPNQQDRVVLFQGVACPTVYTDKHREQNKDLYAQSSWFFRPYYTGGLGGPLYSPVCADTLHYTARDNSFNPNDINLVEIQGIYTYDGPAEGNEPKYNDQFKVDNLFNTFHSPDIEFDETTWLTDFTGTKVQDVGYVEFLKTFSDIDIQTETPTISSNGNGFYHQSFIAGGSKGIISGLFWDDYIVEDESTKGFRPYANEKSPYKWLVYPWHRTGSLNNDIMRPENRGVRSAMLKKKVISNLRYARTTYATSTKPLEHNGVPQIFKENEVSILKSSDGIYQGNIDTLLSPTESTGWYFAFAKFAKTDYGAPDIKTPFNQAVRWRTGAIPKLENGVTKYVPGIQHYEKNSNNEWKWENIDDTGDVGEEFDALAKTKENVRMKYKSTPHALISISSGESIPKSSNYTLRVFEIVRPGDNPNKPDYRATMFGGTSDDAKKANTWVPCGEPVLLPDPDSETPASSRLNEVSNNETSGATDGQETTELSNVTEIETVYPDDFTTPGYVVPADYDHFMEDDPERYEGIGVATGGASYEGSQGEDTEEPSDDVVFYADYGDTYFQRWDCLKTYPFSQDDINQIVEIGSFMLETHVNIDGRYDRNRGQMDNTNMSPINFNLLNPVYSQIDNFFSYKILDSDFYKLDKFPNQITWTKEKQPGADIDLWTNITLASTYDMDGSKGQIVSLNTWKDNIYCFQNKGISNILFNSRVQIPTSDGVPIEISNNYKVDGYRYLSDGIGCNSRQLIKESPFGIYFIDSVSSNLHHIADGIKDVATTHNMTSWFRDNADNLERLVYDELHRDLYVVGNDDALCFSELLDQFTSFYDYGSMSLMESYGGKVFSLHNSTLYRMFSGEYNYLFEQQRPWSLTFISNGLGSNASIYDKTFTNLEFRACVDGDGEYAENTDKFTPTMPLDFIETWNEYQRGIAYLGIRNGHADMTHHSIDNNASLKRKFRIWRCDIPRNNAPTNDDRDSELGIMRKAKPNDRMRNPWLYVRLQKNAETGEDSYLKRTELHNLMLTYFV